MMKDDRSACLRPTSYIDSDAPPVAERSRAITDGVRDDVAKAVRLYYDVRDGIPYNPYRMSFDRAHYRASFVLELGEGFCIQKAILLAAMARAAGIPARLRFANVRNHLATRKLREAMKTDVFVFHGYDELFLEGKWVKCTPAFNLSLCEKFGTLPLEFDGRADSVFHPFDARGNRHMEYLHDYGGFDDFPFDKMIEEFRTHYPHLGPYIERQMAGETVDFEREAADERARGNG